MLPSFVGLMTLLILSLPIVSGHLIKLLEKRYTQTTTNEIVSADTVVVLSGILRTIKKKCYSLRILRCS